MAYTFITAKIHDSWFIENIYFVEYHIKDYPVFQPTIWEYI